MSDDRHPDLDDFYSNLMADDPDNSWEDEDGDDDEYFPAAEMDDIFEEDDDDDDEDDDDDDDDMPPYTVVAAEDDDDEDDEPLEDPLDHSGLLNLAALINGSASGTERESLLARLLAGPTRVVGGGAGGMATRLAQSAMVSDEERARRAAERRKREQWWTPLKEPDPAGLALLRGGEFGDVHYWEGSGRRKRVRLQADPRMRPATFKSSEPTIPNTPGTIVASYPSVPYVGQYCGPDYGVFYAATQYFTLHLYSTKQPKSQARRLKARPAAPPVAQAPPTPSSAGGTGNEEDWEDEDEDEDDGMLGWGGNGGGYRRGEDTSMKKIKTVQGIEGRWTVTDADADRAGQKMIYSSITPYVHMLYTSEHDSEHVEFDFTAQSRRSGLGYYDHFGIWSIRFSADGKEVVAGAGNGYIMVYDIESRRRSLAVNGHVDDVNAVCFADEASTNILVSGSDDGYVKVWDRRSLSSSTPSGVLVGATEGITYISPKGDGRYVVANSKDQAARLYDLRQMRSWSEFEDESDAVAKYGNRGYDYRHMKYPVPKRLAHPRDCSVMTYRGHSVVRTLIRCHFSPRESTGQNYIYSGSADGLIHIWSLDGQGEFGARAAWSVPPLTAPVVQVLNRAESAPLRTGTGAGAQYTDPSGPAHARRNVYGAGAYESRGLNWTVRDVAWHGREPTLMSTCWEVEGSHRHGGSLAKHEWKGLGKNGLDKLEDWVQRERDQARA